MLSKTYWKCRICDAVHLGNMPPATCPTCNGANSYDKIQEYDAKQSLCK